MAGVLPPARDGFIGRERDLALMRERLGEAREVTLVGPPGIGKTRTALELGHRAADDYEHVAFVPLASARTLAEALAAVGAALELDLPPLPAAELPVFIGAEIARFGRTLLILDNFEQLVDEATVLVDRILERAPEAHLIVTSRARLRLPGELVLELRGLSREEDLLLLIDRVKRLRGEYAPSEVERSQLSAIAERLEGLPLALEVAAGRISLLGAANVAAMPLQDNLRSAIERSWDLLSPAEREVLAACSIFRGGFDLAAATRVLPSGERALDALCGLCEQSLVARAPRDDGQQRFHLYESIREFAASQLVEAGELQLRHAEYYVALGRRLVAEAEGRDAEIILDALSREQGNLIAVADRGLCGDGSVSRELGMRALLALAPLALARGPLEPLIDELDAVLETEVDLPPRLRIAAQLTAGRGHRRLGHLGPSHRHHSAAIALATELGDDALIAKVASETAMTLLAEGELDKSLAMLGEAVIIRDRVDDRAGAAIDRMRMGMALRELGRLDEAEELFEDAKQTFRRGGNAFCSALIFAELAHAALERGDFPRAHQLLREARESGAESVSRLTHAALTGRIGMLAHAERDLATAETALSAAILGLHKNGYRRFEAGIMGYLGVVDLELGRFDLAKKRLQAACDMMVHDARVTDILSGWLCAIEVARGDPGAARRAAKRIGPLRPHDPLSATAHVLASALTGTMPLLPAMRSHDVRLALRLLEKISEAPKIDPPPESLRVAASGKWFVLPGGERGECNRYRALGLILLELVKQRLLSPSQPVSREALIAAGWPGEKIQAEAARNRLKVAVASLRRSGLRELLQHSASGYFLDASVPILVMADE